MVDIVQRLNARAKHVIGCENGKCWPTCEEGLMRAAPEEIAELRALTAWQPMTTAPKTGEIIVWAKSAGGKGALIAHWASDLSGEEQPAFQGWFYWTGHGFTEVCEPEAWMPLSAEKPR